MNRPCLDCGIPTPASRCPKCKARREAARDQQRGGTTARGYGTSHQAEAKRWTIRLQHELVLCARCHLPLERGDSWHLDHTDDRTGYLGPAHVDCNLRAATAKRERQAGG